MEINPNKMQSECDLPLILLASDEPRQAGHLHFALQEERFAVAFAPGYTEIESLAEAHQKAIVLLEVSRHESVEAAVGLALRIKRVNASRFVGYLADRILHNSGLAGDAIFPRNPQYLTEALCSYFQKLS
jgi:hypothetical protein